MTEAQWQPTKSRYAVDSEGRIGRVVDRYEGSIYLRPPGGGREWTVPPEELRPPTQAEMREIQVFTTPVPGTTS
ncbi:hypothetical protein EDD98_6768 [Streptomyces sp. PanSC19]|uniref:hypothetical protein n=1 Tax=Streptomyces sp. PanSC19 TaxID=1520455 RepID=UPI000F49DAFF|nr:hypothetical protein [Streptomyces sp. PanSC19]ROQ27111.1 hypothetical protein EDD98_6768 [Streptomyces sp. PanSC19]